MPLLLKQFGALSPADFERHPVWIDCHTADYDEAWYDDTDEETFRPRAGALPADPSEGILLVRAVATLNDGTQISGFLTPADLPGQMGTMQPSVFVADRPVGFWPGIVEMPKSETAAFFAGLGKDYSQVFPLRISADDGLATGIVEAEVSGWLKA